MKPSFALDFRDGLVTLLHRTSRGWSQVGSTAFGAPDFDEALGYLRATALGLSPRGITTKLVIPNEQILYKQVYAPGPEPAKRKRQIKAALEGATPYPIDDLVYDWWGTTGDLQVAVVAKETLAEAEAFASEHRFNPVSFVGVPENGAFLGEPFFGPTSVSTALLAEGEKVERDSDPVTVIARELPRAEPLVPPQRALPPPDRTSAAIATPTNLPEPSETKPEAPLGVTEPFVSEPYGSAAAAPPVATSPAADAPLKTAEPRRWEPLKDLPNKAPVEAPAPAQVPAPAFAPPVAERVIQQPVKVAEGVTEPVPEPVPAAVAKSAPEPAPEPVPETAFAANPPRREREAFVAQPRERPAKLTDPVPEAPMAMDVAADPPMPEDDTPLAPAAEIVAAFASRRTAAIAAATAGTLKPAALASMVPAVGPAPTQRPASPPQTTPPQTTPPQGANPQSIVPRPNLARTASPGSRETLPFPTKTAASGPKPPINKSGKSTASVTAPGIVGAKRDRNVVPLPTAASPSEYDANRRTTKPGTGLGSKPLPVKGKPRYLGLILTGVLLLLLVAVAAWSSFFMGATDTTGAGTPAAAVTGSLAPTPAPTATAAVTLPKPDATVADTGKTAALPDATVAALPGRTSEAVTTATASSSAAAPTSQTATVAPTTTAASADPSAKVPTAGDAAAKGAASKLSSASAAQALPTGAATASAPTSKTPETAIASAQGSKPTAGKLDTSVSTAGAPAANAAPSVTPAPTVTPSKPVVTAALPTVATPPVTASLPSPALPSATAAQPTTATPALAAQQSTAAKPTMTASLPTAAAPQVAVPQPSTASPPVSAPQSTTVTPPVAAQPIVPVPTAAKPTVAPPTAPKPTVEPAPRTEVATAGVASSEPSGTPQDKIAVASADLPPQIVAPAVLPAVTAGADVSPAAELPPPPYGTVYKFDADGRIVPTPEGILTPEGVLLIAGKPKVTPPVRPATLLPTPIAPAVSDPAASTQATGDTSAATIATAPPADTATPVPSDTNTQASIAAVTPPPQPAPQAASAPALAQDPTLARKHPKSKPANLSPSQPTPDQHGAAPDAPIDTHLAAQHPSARPADLPSPIAANSGADASLASASLASNVFALSTSLIPPARPASLDRAANKAAKTALIQPVQKLPLAQKPAADQPVADATQVASNSAALDAQVEPDTQATAPSLPTNASVAKQATTKRALNEQRVALLAVFGTPSSRFAMIRQANGAVKKVQVGDSIDGGRIGAITDTAIQYQRGGQIVTLSLPTG